MKIVVLGRGFLGKAFEKQGFEVRNKAQVNITPETCLSVLDDYDVIVNCIAKSNTRWCEQKENFQEALWSNGFVPRILSEYCASHGKRFVHISTGCLYGDSMYSLSEKDEVVARLNYTVTKWVGEQGCNEHDLIVRPRLLFGGFEDRNNILCKLPGFSRFVMACNSYSSVDVVVDGVTVLIEHGQFGVFNVACDGNASVAEMAKWVGLNGKGVTAAQLRRIEHLHLVNNMMNIAKLKRFYKPPELREEVMRCWEKLHE